ncbi:MAG: hypothetical protein Q8Q95_01465 [bacterium]|nr:hypothetical protein [bacterium]
MIQNPFSLMFDVLGIVWHHIWLWGWVFLPILLAPFLWDAWLYYIRIRTMKKFKWEMLEFRLPPDVEKSPLAMEQVLAIIQSTLFKGSWWKRYVEGRVQEWFSLEITSFEGELHFYIRTLNQFRNLVEAAIYAQYPQAEIFDAEDYTANVPMIIPNETHNLFGSEFRLGREDGYPIRTYKDFELKTETSKEGGSNIALVDPLAGITETLTRLKKGEQGWIQIAIRPTDDTWKNLAMETVLKLVGRPKKEVPQGSYMLALLKKELSDYAKGAVQAPFKTPEFEPFEWGTPKSDKPHSLMQFLTSGEKEIIEAIERKIAKVAFETVIRVVYIATKDAFYIPNFFHISSGFNQFSTQNLNAIKRNNATLTAGRFPFKKMKEAQKKKWLLYQYRIRGRPKVMSVMNIEELATVFHFPGRVVMAPSLPRVQAKKGEPPAGLPSY